jgi:hypothetical protein
MGIWYRTGTASVANGSTAVTGVGTTWLVTVRPGDRITFDGGGKWYEVAAIPSNTSITLATNFDETTISPPGVAYAVDPSSYRHQIPSDILEQMRAVLAGQTNVFEVDGLPPNDFGGDDDLGVDFAGLDLYYKAAGAWVGPIPMAYGDGFRFLFGASTTMADPGAGFLRLNHATIASVTAIAIDDQAASPGNPDVSAAILAWDDSTTLAHRGLLTIRKRSDPSVFAIFRVSGASTDNAGWTQIAVAHVVSVGAFSASDVLAVSFERTGNAGDVSGPSSSVNGRIAVFFGTSGKILAEGSVSIAEIVDPLTALATPKQITVDFGAHPGHAQKVFDVALAGAAPGQKVVAAVTSEMPAGVAEDELEMDPLVVTGRVLSAGNIRIAVTNTMRTKIRGQRRINVICS